MKFKIYILSICALGNLFQVVGQQTAKKAKYPTYFGIQIRPILPSSVLGQEPANFIQGNYESQLSLTNGVSYGATIRAGFTKLFAFETGIAYTKRNFHIDYQYPDSNIVSQADFSFINFDIPANILTYVQLSEAFFMNASLGVQLRFNPSNAGVKSNPSGNNEFNHVGFPQYVNFDFNANFGFEFRTKENGFFYIGSSACVPLQKVFEFYATYAPKSAAFDVRASGPYRDAYLAIDLKYFFPYRKTPSKGQPKGIIE